MTRFTDVGRRYWDLLVDGRSSWIIIGALGLHLSLTMFTHWAIQQDFKNSADDYVQFLMATMFSEGRVDVPSPEPREFFNFTHVVNNGRFFGKYPPGWPALMSLGIQVGIPWVLNPILGVLTLVLVHRIALQVFSLQVANLSLYLLALNPFYIFNSASYYSHTSCLFFICLFLWAYFRNLSDLDSWSFPIILGLTAGMTFLIRPYTAVAVFLPLALHQIYTAERSARLGVLLSRAPVALACFTPFLAGFMLYNYALTGDALLQPFVLYDVHDAPKLLLSSSELGHALRQNVWGRMIELNVWAPLIPLSLVGFFLLPSTRLHEHARLLIILWAAQFIAYFFYWSDGGNRFGPRYIYESLAALIMVSSFVIWNLGKVSWIAFAVTLLLNVGSFAWACGFYSHEIQERKRLFDMVEEQGITNALVFLRTGSGTMGRGDLVRNGIHFDRSVLFVHDLGRRNRSLLRAYPKRRPYVYEYDFEREEASLRPRVLPRWP